MLLTKTRIKNIQLIFSLVLTISIIFRYQLLNGFDQLSADFIYDNLIHTSILEHWFNVYRNINSWSEVGYFYPYQNTIAQTDAYFLVGIIYSFFRFLNFDPFLSTEFSNVVLKSIGFLGAYFLGKNILKTHYASLLLAVLFTLNNASTIHIYRIQLNSVAFIPILSIMLYKSIEALTKNQSKRFLFLSSSFGILLGAMALTCFYISFFYILFIFIFFILFSIFSWAQTKQFISLLIKNLKVLFLSLGITLISFYPFISTFLPKSFETGTKEYPYFALINLPGILQMGRSNLIWGPIYNGFLAKYFPDLKIDYASEYYNMGFSPLLLFFFFLALIWLFKNFYTNKLYFIIALSFLVSFTSILIINNFSFWYFIHKYVFGAQALTVVSIFTIVLALPLSLTVIHYVFSNYKNKIFLTIFSVVAIVFELNSSSYKLNRSEQLQTYTNFSNPTIKCSSFFVGGWEGQEVFYNYWEWLNNQYAHNVSAMYISQKLNIPTINGKASFIPKDYNLVGPNGTAFSPHSQEYLSRVKNYIKEKKLKNVCYLNLNTQQFEKYN